MLAYDQSKDYQNRGRSLNHVIEKGKDQKRLHALVASHKAVFAVLALW